MAEWARIACDRELLKDDPTLGWVSPGHPLDQVYDLLSGKVEEWSDRAISLNWASKSYRNVS
ncbi:hypothetical protein [Laspinema palackyanum]|uniref:hypothetical protein n=1 Tax=Laspinema palackyanum TaxID=3231601 RepID=UPI00345CDD61|nr:hypothetical protein [Laspinema sp. D2c]